MLHIDKSLKFYFTVKPSARKQSLWASMNCLQASSPFCIMHSSRNFLVSGQLQQIFLPDFPTAT